MEHLYGTGHIWVVSIAAILSLISLTPAVMAEVRRNSKRR